ncbi:MAG: cation:proton antiporter, partial [Phaeodactylibacter sp.]|nr:cation:proton antiporter [Phaeodactylibacter sp.]
LALVLLVFVFSDILAHESGLLTVVVMGTVLGNLNVPRLKDILYFKESLSVLLISILFILLAANINMSDLLLLQDIRCLWLFLVVILILRPLGVFLSTSNAGLSVREKIFISWVGPRGIVAAGIASLFGIRLLGEVPNAEYITPLVFMIVLGTVLLNATTAKPLARLLKVTLDASNGVLIIGAHKAARLIARYLQDNNRHVVLVDSSESNIEDSEREGLEAFQANIFSQTLEDQFELLDMGYLLALTSSVDVNRYAIRKYDKIFGEKGSFRLITPNEMKGGQEDRPQSGIFSYYDDFINISEVARDFPNIFEMDLHSKEHLKQMVEEMAGIPKSVPLFIKYSDGFIDTIPADLESLDVSEGDKLVYLGKRLEIMPERTTKVSEPA